MHVLSMGVYPVGLFYEIAAHIDYVFGVPVEALDFQLKTASSMHTDAMAKSKLLDK